MNKVVVNVKERSPLKVAVTITNDRDNVTGRLYQWLTTNEIVFTDTSKVTTGSPSVRLMTVFDITSTDCGLIDRLITAITECDGIVYCIDNTHDQQFSVLITPNGEHIGFSW